MCVWGDFRGSIPPWFHNLYWETKSTILFSLVKCVSLITGVFTAVLHGCYWSACGSVPCLRGSLQARQWPTAGRAVRSTFTSPPLMDGKNQATPCGNQAKLFSAQLQKVWLRQSLGRWRRNHKELRYGHSVRNDLSDYFLFLQISEDTCLSSGNTFDLDFPSCQKRKESTHIC